MNNSVNNFQLKKENNLTISRTDIAPSKIIKRKEKINKENTASYINDLSFNQNQSKFNMKK